MCPLLKKSPGRRGALLIEAAAAMAILAGGLVTVMQSFAVQRRAVTYNMDATQAVLALQSRVGALYAGARTDQLPVPVRNVHQQGADGPKELPEVGLAILSAPLGASLARTLDIAVYARKSLNRGL